MLVRLQLLLRYPLRQRSWQHRQFLPCSPYPSSELRAALFRFQRSRCSRDSLATAACLAELLTNAKLLFNGKGMRAPEVAPFDQGKLFGLLTNYYRLVISEIATTIGCTSVQQVAPGLG